MPVDSPNHNGVAVPHPPSGRCEFCKRYKEEQKDKPSVQQDTFATWCRQVPKLRGHVRRNTFSKLPEIQSNKEQEIEEEVDKIQSFFTAVLKRKQGSTDITKSPDHRDGDALKETEHDDTEYASFCRHLAEGCWDLWCLQKYISDVKALDIPYESSNIDGRSTTSTETTSTTGENKFLRKLRRRWESLHDSLKFFIDERKVALRWHISDILETETEMEYKRLERSSKFYQMYKDLLAELMLPNWHKKVQVDPEDPFYFKQPQDLIEWLSCLEMLDLVDA